MGTKKSAGKRQEKMERNTKKKSEKLNFDVTRHLKVQEYLGINK